MNFSMETQFSFCVCTDDVWRRLDESRIFQTHGFRVILRKQSEATLRAVGRAIDRNPKNPSFLSVIRSHHLRKGNMHLPTKMTSARYMNPDLHLINLCVLDEHEQKVDEREATVSERKKRGGKYVSTWVAFCKDNMVVEGDVFLLELVDRETNLFCVRLFRARDG
ncbi:hypothetical protein LINGRAHAP2_LOCUS36187 [Linum grandiflorum]